MKWIIENEIALEIMSQKPCTFVRNYVPKSMHIKIIFLHTSSSESATFIANGANLCYHLRGIQSTDHRNRSCIPLVNEDSDGAYLRFLPLDLFVESP